MSWFHTLMGAGGGTAIYEYQNAQAAQWATKLAEPIPNAYAALYDQLFTDIGDIITSKADHFGIQATVTQDAAIKNLVYAAPDLTLINDDMLTWTKDRGFAHATDRGTTFIEDVIIQNGGSGYTSAPTVTFSAPTGVGPVTATGTAVISGGSVVSVTITNPGAGYAYGGSAGVPTVSFSGGGGSGAVAAPRIRMGRIYTGIKPGDAGIKLSQNDISVGVGSTQFLGTRGACVGNGLANAVGGTSASRCSLGTSIGKWQGGTLSGTADIGVYSTADIGHYIFSRNNSTNFDRYFNGGKLSSPSSTSAANSTYEFVLLSRRLNDTWTSLSTHAWSWIGKALTDAEALRMYYAVNRFLSALGVESPAVVPFSTSMTVS